MATRVALNNKRGDAARWATIKNKEELNAGDRRAMRGAAPVQIVVNEERRQVTRQLAGDFEDQQRNALLARIITDWNLQWPLPAGDPAVFDDMPIDQLDKLYEAIEPHMLFLNGGMPDPTEKDTDPTSPSES